MTQPQTFETPEISKAPPPWNYNPSRWSQRILVCILAGIAAAIASYMALYQWRLIGSVWDPIFGKQTENVLDSDVSEWIRRWMLFPDAALGAIAYLGDAIFGLAGSTRRWQCRPWIVILFGIDVIPVGIVSAILVVLQGAVVGSWCFLCLVTAVISLTLILFAFDEVWSCLVYLYRVWERTKNFTILWKTLCGQPTKEAQQVGLEIARSE